MCQRVESEKVIQLCQLHLLAPVDDPDYEYNRVELLYRYFWQFTSDTVLAP